MDDVFESLPKGIEVPSTSLTEYVLGSAVDSGRPAVIDGATGEVCSRSEVIRRVGLVAAALARRDVHKGDVVALAGPNCLDYVSAVHGMLHAGAVVTPVNPRWTAAEISDQMRNAGAVALFTLEEGLSPSLEAAHRAGITTVIRQSEVEQSSSSVSAAEAVADDLAVLPFSSGTTGLPKGVMLTHRNMVANLEQVIAVSGFSEDEIVVAPLPFFHIYGLQLMLNLSLRLGMVLVVMGRYDLELYLSLVERYRATRLYGVPPMILALAKDPAVDRFDIGSVRRIVSGGAPLGADLAVAAGERLGCEVVQGYGMTETSAVASLTPPGPSPLGTVGKLLPGMQLRIVGLGAGAGPHPDGIGELQFRGPNIMHGYMGDDPASAFTEDGWLPSGDIGRRDADGFLYIVDRSKEVLKYKGFQVAPAELEAVLVTHPDVVDAGVIGMPDEESGELPVAFVVADTTVSEPELLDYCTRKLAHYKRVHHIMFVESIPRSESGKILRRELRRLLSGGS